MLYNLHPIQGTHCVLVRRSSVVHYVDNFGVEIPPKFLHDYINLGSNERIQFKNESYSGAYSL